MKVGVLALQGDFREHISVVINAGHEAIAVRRPEELAEVERVIAALEAELGIEPYRGE